MIPDRNLDTTRGQHGSSERSDPGEPDILDLIDEEVAQITPADIEDRLRETLRRVAFGPRPHVGTGLDASGTYATGGAFSNYEVPSIIGPDLDRAAETWEAFQRAQYEIRATRRKAELIMAEARAEAGKAREEADRALSNAAQIIRHAREQAEKIISDAHREAEQIKAQAAPDYGLNMPTAHNEFTVRLTWQPKHGQTDDSDVSIVDAIISNPGSTRVHPLESAATTWKLTDPSASKLLVPPRAFPLWQPGLVDDLVVLRDSPPDLTVRQKLQRMGKSRGSKRSFIDAILSDALTSNVFHRWLEEIARRGDVGDLIVILDNLGSDYALLEKARVINRQATPIVGDKLVASEQITHIAAPKVFYPIPDYNRGLQEETPEIANAPIMRR